MGAINQLDPIWNFSRASSATRVNASGLVETVASNVPRFDFDPVTLKCKGLLLEPSRTNYSVFSNQFDSGAWGRNTGVTVTPNTHTAPDGTMSANTVSYDGSGASGTYRLYDSAIPTASVPGTKYTSSIYLKASTPVTLRLANNLGVFITVNITSVWQRFSVTGTGDGTATVQIVLYSNTGDNSTFSVQAYGSQVEIGGDATSYIPTGAYAVTRSADACYTEALEPWWSPTSGTVRFEWERRTKDYYQGLVGMTGNTYFGYLAPSSDSVVMALPSVSGAVTGGVAGLGINKAAFSFSSGTNTKATINGLSPFSMPAIGTFSPIVARLRLGDNAAGGENINGHVRSFQFLPYPVDDFTLKAMTL
jgi:hypothetical protein